MSAHLQADPSKLDQSSCERLVELLGRLHPLLMVADAEGSLLWESPGWPYPSNADPSRPGIDLFDAIPGLVERNGTIAPLSPERWLGTLANLRVEVMPSQEGAPTFEVTVLRLPVGGADRPLVALVARPLEPSRASDVDAVFECAAQAILTVDEDGFVNEANPAAGRLLGREASELRGLPAAALASRSRDLERLLSALLAARETSLVDLRLRRGDGSTLHASATLSPLRLRGGEPRGSVVSLRDASESLETELAQRNEELEHCVDTLAHDLRSPLVALLGFSRLLRQDYGDRLDATASYFIDRIEDAGRTMESLIHDLLELSRIGQPGERRTMVDPRAVLLQLAAEAKVRLDERAIRLSLPGDPPLVYCDRTRLYQVFSNLIGNAIDHMGSSEDPRIAVDVFDETEFHHLCVSDTGQGIPVEQQQRIFDAFQSLAPPGQGRSGTGMGLAIVRKIAETHGGRAWVESRPGAGSRFHVTFRRKR